MIPYILVAGASSALGYVTSLKGIRFLWWILPLGLLVLVSGNRNGIGTDYLLYKGFFERVGGVSFADALQLVPQEYGFVLLTWLIRRATDDPRVFFLITAFLTIVPIMVAIRKASPAPAFSLFLYVALGFYPRSFNTVRQSLAVACVLLAEVNRYERRWLWVLLSVLAPFIHISALLIVIGMLPLSRLRLNMVHFAVLLALAIAAGATVFHLPNVQNLLSGLNSRYEGYVGTSAGGGVGTVLRLIVVSGLVAISLYYSRRRGFPGRDVVLRREDRYVTYFAVSALVLALGLVNLQLVRFEEYLGIFGILAIPIALQGLKYRALLVGAISVGATAYLAAYVINYGGVVPYVWQ